MNRTTTRTRPGLRPRQSPSSPRSPRGELHRAPTATWCSAGTSTTATRGERSSPTSTSGTRVRQVTHPPKGVLDNVPDWSPDGRRIAFQRVDPNGCGPRCETDEIWVVTERRKAAHARRVRPRRARAASPRAIAPAASAGTRPAGRPTASRSRSRASRCPRVSARASSMPTGAGSTSSRKRPAPGSPTSGRSGRRTAADSLVQRVLGDRRAVFVTRRRRKQSASHHSLVASRRRARLVSGREADRLHFQRGRPIERLGQPLHGSPGRDRPEAADARPRRARAVPLGVVLAGRQVAHGLEDAGIRKEGERRRVRDARRRHGPAAGHACSRRGKARPTGGHDENALFDSRRRSARDALDEHQRGQSDLESGAGRPGTLAFGSNRDGNAEIYLMTETGRVLRRLTNDPKFDAFPTWSPGRPPNRLLQPADAERRRVRRERRREGAPEPDQEPGTRRPRVVVARREVDRVRQRPGRWRPASM